MPLRVADAVSQANRLNTPDESSIFIPMVNTIIYARITAIALKPHIMAAVKFSM